MFSSTTSSFGLQRELVEEMTIEGESLESVEEMLESTELPPDEKDALWLFAWSLGRRVRRPADRAARRLALVPAPDGV